MSHHGTAGGHRQGLQRGKKKGVGRVNRWKVSAFVGLTTLAVAIPAMRTLGQATNTNPIPKDTVFSTDAQNTDRPVVWKLEKGKDPVEFARVDPHDDSGPWLAPLAFGPNGHLYLVSKGANGTLLDVTTGGDRTKDKAVATGIFTEQPSKMCGLAFDAAGNAYMTNSEVGKQPIARIDMKTGKVSTLKGEYDGPRGLAILTDANKKEILYIVEGGTGIILSYNLTDDKPGDKPFATGFPVFASHQGGALAVDRRNGHLMLLISTDPNDENTGAVFDITAGGEFKDLTKTPPLVKYPNRMDVNGLSIDSKGNLYVGGDNTHMVWVSTLDAAAGKYGAFQQLNNDSGECETVTVAP